MKISVSAKTVEEAIRIGVERLETTEDQVIVNVIEEPTRGLFGFIGGREAKVEIEKKIDSAQAGLSFLQQLIKDSRINVTAELAEEQEGLVYTLAGEEVGIFIGRRGQTLDALQYLLSIVVNRNAAEYIRVTLDAENFRKRRKQTLERLALRLADKVTATGKEVVLEPMTAKERRIIHAQLQDNPRVKTFSKGKDPNRRIVIGLKD